MLLPVSSRRSIMSSINNIDINISSHTGEKPKYSLDQKSLKGSVYVHVSLDKIGLVDFGMDHTFF